MPLEPTLARSLLYLSRIIPDSREHGMFSLSHRRPIPADAPDGAAIICRSRTSGVALVEAMVAVMLLTLTIIVSTQAMLQTNRQAAQMRTMAAARGIVQRNIDTALTVAWDSTVEPPILALTGGLPANYNDGSPDPAGSDNVQIATMQDDAAATGPVTGTMTRTVTNVSTGNPVATLRRITIQLDYSYNSRPYSIQMTTERAIDD